MATASLEHVVIYLARMRTDTQEFYVRIVYELVQNKDIYLNDTYVSKVQVLFMGGDLQLIRLQCFLSTITPCLD